MTGRAVFLALLLISVAAGEEKMSGQMRKPDCARIANVGQKLIFCPRNYEPVCGNNGITYFNECMLCLEMLQSKVDILIVKEGQC